MCLGIYADHLICVIPTLLMKEPGLREVKVLAQHETSSKCWCQDLDLSLSGPTCFLLRPGELAAPGGVAGGSVGPITHSTEDRVSTQERGQQRASAFWSISVGRGKSACALSSPPPPTSLPGVFSQNS